MRRFVGVSHTHHPKICRYLIREQLSPEASSLYRPVQVEYLPVGVSGGTFEPIEVEGEEAGEILGFDAELSRQHLFSPRQLVQWKSELLERVPHTFEQEQASSAHQERNAELEWQWRSQQTVMQLD